MNFFESIVLHHRQAPTVNEQPSAEMTNWRGTLTPCCQDRLLTGWLRGSESLRVTTAIKNVDAASWTVTTESGRAHEILTPPTADTEYFSLIFKHSKAMGLVVKGMSLYTTSVKIPAKNDLKEVDELGGDGT